MQQERGVRVRGAAALALVCGALGLTACASVAATPDAALPPPPDGSTGLVVAHARSRFQVAVGACPYASPVLSTVGGRNAVVVVDRLGRVSARDPENGAELWSAQLPSAEGTEVSLLSTPALVHDRYLVAAWQEITPEFFRTRHRVSVVDLTTQELSSEFELLEVSGLAPAHDGTGDILFEAQWQLQRSRLVHVDVPDRTLGLVYLAYGNGPSDQPFHGWVFELDMDRWRAEGASDAIVNTLLTTRERDCGAPGSRDPMRCGGGVWNSWGLEIVPGSGGDYSILMATGNGRVDFDSEAYAHSVLRTRRGLALTTGCDDSLCAPFDELDPATECLESCRDIFVARLEPGDAPLAPEDGGCEGLTFLECYGSRDADLGANAPVEVALAGGQRVVVQTGKDGALYLLDADHLGTLHQRLALRDFCGTTTDTCRAVWAGSFVTRPAVARVGDDPVVIVASLMADSTHYSGITAVRVSVESGAPRMTPLWDWPSRDDAQGVLGFREHPGVPVVMDVEGEPYVFVVEVRREMPSPPGVLWGVRVRDGYASVRHPLGDSGIRYAWPLIVDDTLYVTGCGVDAWTTGSLEAIDISAGL